jgi:hypothetical protein
MSARKPRKQKAEKPESTESPRGRGRPSSFKPEYVAQAQKFCALGATTPELADFFEVSSRTIERWSVEHEDFCRALKLGKEQADDRVEKSLYHRALGFKYETEKIFCNKDGVVTKVPHVEMVAPDTTACIFWLKNRRPEKWRDVHKHEHGLPGQFDGMTKDELSDYIRAETAELGLGDPSLPVVGGVGVASPEGRPN